MPVAHVTPAWLSDTLFEQVEPGLARSWACTLPDLL
jgi:hypothetical protein